jgi:hypothetical protein
MLQTEVFPNVFVVTCVTKLKLNQEKWTGGIYSPDIYNEGIWEH